MPVNPPRALLLDLDSTLLDNREMQRPIRRTCEIVAQIVPRLDADALEEANASVWADYFPEISEPWTLGRIDGAAVSLEAWRRTLARCGADDPELAQSAWSSYAQLCRESYRLFDDAAPLLARAREAGIATALVTNGASDTQREKLAAVGISALFDAIVISGEVRLAKPDPTIFAIALGRLGTGSAAAWHVGDSLAADVAGARAAGLTAVWLNRGGMPAGPSAPRADLEVASLAELLPLLAN